MSQANRGYGYGNHDYNRNQNNYGRTTTTQSSYPDSDEYPLRSIQSQQKYLRLIWSERDNNLEYTFNYTTSAPGQWSNIGDQRGSLVTLNTYTQFTGTVQVVKAVNDHLVLTFCGNDVKSSIYTVVLTRNRLGLSLDVSKLIFLQFFFQKIKSLGNCSLIKFKEHFLLISQLFISGKIFFLFFKRV